MNTATVRWSGEWKVAAEQTSARAKDRPVAAGPTTETRRNRRRSIVTGRSGCTCGSRAAAGPRTAAGSASSAARSAGAAISTESGWEQTPYRTRRKSGSSGPRSHTREPSAASAGSAAGSGCSQPQRRGVDPLPLLVRRRGRRPGGAGTPGGRRSAGVGAARAAGRAGCRGRPRSSPGTGRPRPPAPRAAAAERGDQHHRTEAAEHRDRAHGHAADAFGGRQPRRLVDPDPAGGQVRTGRAVGHGRESTPAGGCAEPAAASACGQRRDPGFLSLAGVGTPRTGGTDRCRRTQQRDIEGAPPWRSPMSSARETAR